MGWQITVDFSSNFERLKINSFPAEQQQQQQREAQKTSAREQSETIIEMRRKLQIATANM
jgi:hypothetical protein